MRLGKTYKKLFLLLFLIVFCGFCGCETIDNNVAYVKTLMKSPLNLKEDGNKNTKTELEQSKPQETPAVEQDKEEQTDEITLPTMDELLIMNEARLSGVSGEARAVIAPSGDIRTVTLYFVDQNSSALVAEKRSIQKVEGIARKTMEELVAGPENGANGSVFPAGTKLKDININKEGICILDFSPEIKSITGSDKSRMYDAISKTLSQFDNIKKIEIRVDGVKVDTITK